MQDKEKPYAHKTEAGQIEDLKNEIAMLRAEAENLKNQLYYMHIEMDALKTAEKIIKESPEYNSETTHKS